MLTGILMGLILYLVGAYGTFRAWLWLSPPMVKERTDYDYRKDEMYVVDRFYVVQNWQELFSTRRPDVSTLDEASMLCLAFWWAIIPMHIARKTIVRSAKVFVFLRDFFIPDKFILKGSDKGEGVR